MIIFINKDNFVASHYILDATTPLEITDQQWKAISFTPDFYAWQYNSDLNSFSLIQLIDLKLRATRDKECFKIIDNRSPLWFNHLTDDQKQELDNWYQAWLDVTETKIIPEKPDWLK